MLIRFQNGTSLEAIILALQGDTLRVAIKGSEDIMVLRMVSGIWLTEDCEPVTFDFTMAILAAVGIVPPADILQPEAALAATADIFAAATAEYLN